MRTLVPKQVSAFAEILLDSEVSGYLKLVDDSPENRVMGTFVKRLMTELFACYQFTAKCNLAEFNVKKSEYSLRLQKTTV
eukprot:7165094-Pyramimonas_sp.AAC.1